MTALFLYDDAVARAFEPFALTRPVSELRAGAALIRERWERALATRAAGFLGAPLLADFTEAGAPQAMRDEIPAGAIVAHARFAPALAVVADSAAHSWSAEGRVAAVRLARATSASAFADGTLALESLAPGAMPAAELRGWWLDEVWDPIRHLQAMLSDDILALAPALHVDDELRAEVIGSHPVLVERGARIEPLSVFDASGGPILVRRGAVVQSFTRLAGPCLIGHDTIVHGGKISGSAIGDGCRVHGELSTSIFLGHANKAHDGFVGHSILGRWVNLGASTVTSNLKNTYGTVDLWTPDGPRDTGLQFLGTLFGDHVKTAIGTRLTTGSIIGAGANVFGTPMTPKVVPPFAWGCDGAVYDVERFLLVAGRAMQRRNVPLDERTRRQLGAAHASRWSAGR